LVRKVTIERGPRKQGDPGKVVKEEEWNILDFIGGYIPKVEASLRGMQEDVDMTKNRVIAVGKTLIGMEKAAMALANAADRVKLIRSEVIEIDESNPERG